MPIDSKSDQRAKEGNFYFQKQSEKKFKEIPTLDNRGFRISQNQLLTKTALGLVFLLGVVDSIEAEKSLTSDKLPSTPLKTTNTIDWVEIEKPPLTSDESQEKLLKSIFFSLKSKKNFYTTIKTLIKNGDKKRALEISSAYGYDNIKIFEALIDNGIDVNASNTVKALIDTVIDVNASDKDGTTSLHLASENGHLDIVKLLIKKGANIAQKNKDGEEALRIASENGHLDIVTLLINAGADVNTRKNNGRTSLSIASERGHIEIVKLLINAGADLNASDNNGVTALHIVSDRGPIEIVKLFINAGADVNASDNNGVTALHIASHNGDINTAKLLIENGAYVNQKDKNGQSALGFASQGGHIEIVKLLSTKIDQQSETEKSEIAKIQKNSLEKKKQTERKKIKVEQPVKLEQIIKVKKSAEIKQPDKVESGAKIKEFVEEKQLDEVKKESSYSMTSILATSSAVAVTTAISCGFLRFPNQKLEKDAIRKGSILIESINNYLDKLPFFTLEKIEPLQWKIKNNNLVLELEHQPEDLKTEISNFFAKNCPQITSQNIDGNKTIISFDRNFIKRVEGSNSESPEYRKFQSIKDKLEALGNRKNAEFENEYGVFFRGLNKLDTEMAKSMYEHSLIGDEHISSLLKLQRLINFGLADTIGINDIQTSNAGQIGVPDFYSDDITADLDNKMKSDGSEESRDSTHNGIRIGARIFGSVTGVDEMKYFVKFSENPSDVALACTTIDREVSFFKAKTNDQFEILELEPITKAQAESLLEKIKSISAPSRQIQVQNRQRIDNSINQQI